MRFNPAVALGAIALGALLTGPAVAAHVRGPIVQTGGGRPTAARSGTLVYGCGGNECIWYRQGSNSPAGTIVGLMHPRGLGVDSHGNIYITNSGASNVLVYAKGSTTLLKTLQDPGQVPADVAISGGGTVFVANGSTTAMGPGSISVYAHGSTKPTRQITDPNFGFVSSIALDEALTLYACYDAGPNGNCDKFPHAQGHGSTVITFQGIVGGIKTDLSENVAVNNGFSAATNVYSGPQLTQCNTIAQGGFPFGLAFDRAGGRLFVANPFKLGIIEETYSGCIGGGTVVFTYSAGWKQSNAPYTVAVDPAPGP